MATWFTVRVVFDKTNEKGITVKAKELYLIDAMSFTEAEARAVGELTPFAYGEFRVTAMKIEDIAEVFNEEKEEGRWYRVKVICLNVDMATGKAKKEPHSYLVHGTSTEDATKKLHERMKGTLVDYEVHTVSETQYIDVFFYELEKESEETR